MGKPGVAGVHANQRLNLSTPWEGLQMICQGFKPDLGNPAVRHYRGASGTVRHGEIVNPSCNRKSGNGNPSPTVGRARSLSQPCEPMVMRPSGAALAGLVLADRAPSVVRYNISRRVTRTLLELRSLWSRRDGRMRSLRVPGGPAGLGRRRCGLSSS